MDELTDKIDLYTKGWTDMMLTIWREQIERLRVIDTGALHQSFTSQVNSSVSCSSISMKFLKYGLYVAAGTGKGYSKGISGQRNHLGQLLFLDEDYRKEHKLGNPRKAKDWFNKKYYKSFRVLVEDVAYITGRQAANIVADAIEGHDSLSS